MNEVIERRYLGGFRFIDSVTGVPLSRELKVAGTDSTNIFRNRSGAYVIASAALLEKHVTAFDRPPDQPNLGSVTVKMQVTDPDGTFLPQWFSIPLPRDPDPDNRDEEASLFHIVDVPLVPAPAYGASSLWSGVRLSIASGAAGVAEVYIQITDDDDGGKVLATGISDTQGEAFLPLPGIRPFRHAAGHGGNVMTMVTAATLTASWEAGRTWPPDPEALAARHAGHVVATVPLELTSGKIERVKIKLA